MPFSQNDLVAVTREVETTPGTVVGGARSRVYGTAPSWTPGGNTIKSGINTGDGGVKSVRAGLRFADADVPSELVFGLNREELADFLRMAWPVSRAKVSAVQVTFNNAGTHEDGSTGPVILAVASPNDAFSPLVGMDGAMLEVSGAGVVNAANKRPRAIKNVWSDGSQIDLEPLYVTGSVGQISEPLISETNVAATLDCGRVIRNQGVLAIRSVNFEYEFTDQQDGGDSSFVMVRGCKANTLRIAFDGKGVVTLNVVYVGMDYDNPTTTTQGNGTVTANAYLDNENMTSAEDLTYFLVGAVTQLAGDNLTSFSLDGAGAASGIDETSGSRNRVGVTVGDVDITGSINVLHEHTKMAILSALGRAGTKVPLDMKLADPDGNFYWIRLPETLFEPGGPKPGAKGSRTAGSFNFMTQLGANNIRTMIVQEFDASGL
jgi:hypothetical protein